MFGKVSFDFPEIEMEWSDKGASGEITISFKRIEKQLQRAQYELDSQIMTDMEPYMPRETGTFINVTRGMSQAIAGSGYVVAAAPPTGRFLYYGKVMVDPETNSPWARKGAKKIVTGRPLTYSNPKATPKWFETAKEKHGKQWIKKVKEIGGGG
jgi:hypothetical protein